MGDDTRTHMDSELPPAVNVVRVCENGPLDVEADLAIEGHERRRRAALCRCGTSQRKPFCDGSHKVAAFVATGEPDTQDFAALAVRDGPLAVTPIRDGPLMLKGALEIVSASGRTVMRGTEAFLCRCGASAKKPFCDRTHKRTGFVAEGGSKKSST
jgi:CDGSH-type Zn-finger protein